LPQSDVTDLLKSWIIHCHQYVHLPNIKAKNAVDDVLILFTRP